jgi:hypothetical protein
MADRSSTEIARFPEFCPICREKSASSSYYLRNVRGLIPSFKLVLQSLRL